MEQEFSESQDQPREPREPRDMREGGREGGREGRDGREPRERITSFEQMKVWQEAHGLVLRVLEATPALPPEQQDGIALAMEKTAIEVPKAIAEGFGRRGSRNKGHYYNIAQSNLEGLRYYFILCRDLKYDVGYEELADRAETVSRMLDSLVRSMQRQSSEGGRRGRGGRRRGRGRGDGRFPRDPDAPRSYETSSETDVYHDDIGTGD